MAIEQELENVIKNLAISQSARNNTVFEKFNTKKALGHTRAKAKHADKLIIDTKGNIRVQKKKYNKTSLFKTEAVVNNAIDNLTNYFLSIDTSFNSIVNSFGVSIITDTAKNFMANIQNKINIIGNLPQSVVDNLVADAQDKIDGLTAEMYASIASAIDSYAGDSLKQFSSYKSKLSSLLGALDDPILSEYNINTKTGEVVKANYYDRGTGASSTSSYIQANVPNKAGKLTPDPTALKNTPDTKILEGQLKSDKSSVKSFFTIPDDKIPKNPSLSSLTPDVPKLTLPALPTVSDLGRTVSTAVNTAKDLSGNFPTSLPTLDGFGSNLPSNISDVITIPTLPSKPSLKSLPPLDNLTPISAMQDNLDFAAKGKAIGKDPGLIPVVDTDAVVEPKPTGDKAEYGKIQVKENKAGFTEISDETEGNVRKISTHPTGTYQAMLNDGSQHSKTTGMRQDIVDENWNVKIAKDKIVIIDGNEKIEIRKNRKVDIVGDDLLGVTGDKNTLVSGEVKEDFRQNSSEKVGGNKKTTASGNIDNKASGNITNDAGGNLSQRVGGNLTINCTGNVNINSSGNTTINSKGTITISSSSIVRISAPAISLG